MIERAHDAKRLNEILNDPAVRLWVADAAEGTLDVSPQVADPNNVLLMGEHGGCLFFFVMPGYYEVHTQVLPEGRGRWIMQFTQEAARWMFCRTPAVELYTRVPRAHLGAKYATLRAGGVLAWTRPASAIFMGQVEDIDIYRLSLEDWALKAPGLEEDGEEFHVKLHQFAESQHILSDTHANDPNHNRMVGAAIAMSLGGQVAKGVALYNKWALLSRHRPVKLVQSDPPIVEFDIGRLAIQNDDLVLLPCVPN